MTNDSSAAPASAGILFKWGTKRALVFLGSIMTVIIALMITAAYLQKTFVPSTSDYRLETPYAIAFYCLSGLLAATFMLFWIVVAKVTTSENPIIPFMVLNLIMVLPIWFILQALGHCGGNCGIGHALFGEFVPVAIFVVGYICIGVFFKNIKSSNLVTLILAIASIVFVLMIVLIALNVLDPPKYWLRENAACLSASGTCARYVEQNSNNFHQRGSGD